MVREETHQVIPVYVNCRHDHTPLAAYLSIFAQVCGYAPLAGRYLNVIKQGIAVWLRDRNATLIVCLDDADELIPAGTYNLLPGGTELPDSSVEPPGRSGASWCPYRDVSGW